MHRETKKDLSFQDFNIYPNILYVDADAGRWRRGYSNSSSALKCRRAKNFGMEKNNNTSSHILLEHCYVQNVFVLSLYIAFLTEEVSLKKRTPVTYFLPALDQTMGWIWPENNNICKGPWVIHPYQVSSKSIKRFWRRSWKIWKINGRRTARYDNSSLKPSAQVS